MTKKIKIAVAVDSKGNYNAHSYGGPAYKNHPSEKDWADAAYEGLEPEGPEALVWVEVEIPLPQESTRVEGVAGPLVTKQ